MKYTNSNTEAISIVLCGEAGQGIQTVEHLLTRFLKLSGYHVFATKEYMSRVRGGVNATQIRVSAGRITASVDKIDILIPFSRAAVAHLKHRLSKDTFILTEKAKVAADIKNKNYNIIDIPFTDLISEAGGIIYHNTVSAGIISGILEADSRIIEEYITKFFSKKSEDIVQNNVKALIKGYEVGRALLKTGKLKYSIKKNNKVKEDIIINGAEAVGLGAIAGGCDFISSYPMSPSTGVLVFLSGHSKEFNIIAEQAEDEISAINMALGAWYAGARAMVTTSGGGFALMEEGVSLSGMLETPVVIHLAQRPGPATGLPTRTEQGDLELALYSGHGEFPRVIYAPGNTQQAFKLTKLAFDCADKYQVPAFILTDQHLIDTYYNIDGLDIEDLKVQKHIVSTAEDYKRYKLTKDGVSPRGIPGHGAGFVSVDSDEHDEAGHITEDLDMRVKMVDKRLKKLELLKKDIVPPELIGANDYKNLVICWGSTYTVLKEALEGLAMADTAMLHYSQVYPLSDKTADYLKKAKKTVIIENNATAQFGKLIKLTTGIDIEHKVLKYNGLPFTVEEVIGRLKTILD